MAITKISPDVVDFDAGITISTTDNSDNLTLTSTDADANAGPNLRLYRNSGSPADSDALGLIEFEGRNDNSQDVVYSTVDSRLVDASDGTEDGSLELTTIVAGSQVSRVFMGATETVINDNSVDVDFRVESNGNANMLFVDGGNDRVGIGTASPSHMLVAKGAAGTSPAIEMINSDTEDGDTGRESTLRFSGFRSGGEAAINAQITGSHSGTSDDDKGMIIFYTNNGSGLTEKVRIHAEGHVTMPLQPAFLVKLDGDQNNIAVDGGSNTTVEFDSVIFDVGSNFASNQFTAPVTGKYLLTYMLRVHALDDASTSFSVIMETSNRTAANYFDPAGYDSDPDYHTFTYSMVHDMDASDTAKVTVYQAGGSAQADVSQYSYFSGQLIS